MKNRIEDKGLIFSLICHTSFAVFTFYIYLRATWIIVEGGGVVKSLNNP